MDTMVTTLFLLFLILYLVCNHIIAKKMEIVAELKGYGKEVKAYKMCFWLGIIGCLYVVALPDQIQQEQNLKIIKLLKKTIDQNHQNTDAN